MAKKVRNPRDYMLFIVIILFVSLVVNVLLSVNNYKMDQSLGKESYRNIESVRSTNQDNIEILKKSIDIGSIDNAELLKLYKNFSKVSDLNVDLCRDYIMYENESGSFKNKKSVNKNVDIISNINTKIEEYLLNLLNREMQTQRYKLELNGQILDNFKTMEQISNDVEKYYSDFYEDNGLNNLSNEEKSKKSIKNKYWIDILEGINDINYKYTDETFVVE